MVEPNRYEDQPFGLPERTIDDIRRFLMGWPEIEKVIIFGSRAMGNHDYNSDIDMAIQGADLTRDLVHRIRGGLNDLPIAYEIDVAWYDAIDHAPFKEHIDAHGVDFWKTIETHKGA